jgi:hypothetical protein
MKHALALALCSLSLLGSAFAQAAPSSAEREKKFSAMLTQATLKGRWCLVKDGALTPERDETYSIVGVQKGEGAQWIVNARMRYGQQDIVAPVPARVEWAGGAAVLIVENLTIPGGGTYSARVLLHDDIYSGTWSGGGRTGLLHGVISRAE